jgi:membrane-associated HD superfamily phosphohydrolase
LLSVFRWSTLDGGEATTGTDHLVSKGMKLAALSFFLLLIYVHFTGDLERAAEQPLSMFRDDSTGLLGYVLFAALLLVGVLYVVALARSQREAEAIISSISVLILLAVAVTPSTNSFHLLCSLLLFGLLFGYYAILLYRTERILLVGHLIVPIALALAIQFHSYGLWQKSFISYSVFLAAVHHHALTHRHSGRNFWLSQSSGRHLATKRRKVYCMELEQHWQRRDAR